MKKVFRVSKQGLSRCPQCARHIFLEAKWQATRCHFCSAELVAAGEDVPKKATPPRRSTRSNLIAAGLLTASLGVAACDDSGDPDPPADVAVMGGVMAEDAATDAATDAAPDMMSMALDAIVDSDPPLPPYGQPPSTDMSPQPEAALDFGPAPLYGEPPMIDMDLPGEPDAAVDAVLDAAPDAEFQPEYGGPPEPDAAPDRDAAANPPPAPVYGAPPNPPE